MKTFPVNITSCFQEHCQVITALQDIIPQIEELAERMTNSLSQNGKILWMGNGGSAADCQHLAAELVGRFARERKALPSIALTVDTSILTAVANDYSFATVFARQIQALCQPQDIVVGISTSGNSENVITGILAAKGIGAYTVGMTGSSGGKLLELVDTCLRVPSANTPRIQEAHILIGHTLCEWIEVALTSNQH